MQVYGTQGLFHVVCAKWIELMYEQEAHTISFDGLINERYDSGDYLIGEINRFRLCFLCYLDLLFRVSNR